MTFDKYCAYSFFGLGKLASITPFFLLLSFFFQDAFSLLLLHFFFDFTVFDYTLNSKNAALLYWSSFSHPGISNADICFFVNQCT